MKNDRRLSWMWILSLAIFLFSGYRWIQKFNSSAQKRYEETSQASSQTPASIPAKGPAVMTKGTAIVAKESKEDLEKEETLHPLDAFLLTENPNVPLNKWVFDRKRRSLSITGGLFSPSRIGEEGAERLIYDLTKVLSVHPDNQFHIASFQLSKSSLAEAKVYTLQQFFQGFPVYNTLVHVSWSETAKAFFAISSNMVNIQKLDNHLVIGASEARRIVAEEYKTFRQLTVDLKSHDINTQFKPWVVIKEDRARLKWIFDVKFLVPFEEERTVFVDAETGEINWMTKPVLN